MPEYVSKSEFNGLGQRVTEINTSFRECRAAKEVHLTNLNETAATTAENVSKLFDKIEKIDKTVSVQWAKITIGVGVAMAVIQFSLRFLK